MKYSDRTVMAGPCPELGQQAEFRVDETIRGSFVMFVKLRSDLPSAIVAAGYDACSVYSAGHAVIVAPPIRSIIIDPSEGMVYEQDIHISPVLLGYDCLEPVNLPNGDLIFGLIDIAEPTVIQPMTRLSISEWLAEFMTMGLCKPKRESEDIWTYQTCCSPCAHTGQHAAVMLRRKKRGIIVGWNPDRWSYSPPKTTLGDALTRVVWR